MRWHPRDIMIPRVFFFTVITCMTVTRLKINKKLHQIASSTKKKQVMHGLNLSVRSRKSGGNKSCSYKFKNTLQWHFIRITHLLIIFTHAHSHKVHSFICNSHVLSWLDGAWWEDGCTRGKGYQKGSIAMHLLTYHQTAPTTILKITRNTFKGQHSLTLYLYVGECMSVCVCVCMHF